MGISRVEYAGNLLIDISSDTVNKSNLLAGATAHDSNGDEVIGECPFDMDTKSFTAFAEHILKGKTAGVNGKEIIGSMPENEAAEHLISAKEGVFEIPWGYHDGNGTVKINPAAVGLLTPENIRENVEILGVTGTMTGTEGENCSPHITFDAPLDKDLEIQPEHPYTCFKQVTIKKVPYNTEDKTADNKGIWVTIG